MPWQSASELRAQSSSIRARSQRGSGAWAQRYHRRLRVHLRRRDGLDDAELDVETTADRLDERHDVAEHQPSLELDAVRHVREAQREAACARHATRRQRRLEAPSFARPMPTTPRRGPVGAVRLLEARRELGHTLVRATS